ncbi:MAG: AAA family ATPase [Bacteroidetes bacterium]|nr:MAG: AAA family ATPase [Bacteroidota bacterium]
MKTLRNKYLRLLTATLESPKRFLFEQIDWAERLIIIKGQRGTGKTTMLLQYIKLNHTSLEETLYISMDDIYFAANKLSDFIEDFVVGGGRYLYIDEIHRYKNWSVELKNIYDFYPDLKLIITGSSALSFYISTADLGRRAAIYNLPELSFREYLNFTLGTNFKTYSLNDIIKKSETISMTINKEIRSLKEFRNYLMHGAYPFILNGKERYYDKLEASINTIIDNDIPVIENISYDSRVKLRKLLYMMSTTVPFKINMSELSRKLETTRDMLSKYLELLNKAGIIKFLTTEGIGYTLIRKPNKIYFSNSNLIHALTANAEIGTVRETFFLSQLSVSHKVNYPKQSDFMIDNKYTFEIGGKNKDRKQIQDLKNAYLALDDIEYGYGKSIPLWLFGFLY